MAVKITAREACMFCAQAPCVCNVKVKPPKKEKPKKPAS